MKDILKEVILLFPSKYIHIGGDEVPKNSWHKCSKCQAVIKRNKLKSEEELQSYFLSQISAFLTENKKMMIGWDEILEGGLPNNAIVMSWRGEKGGIEAAKKGHQVIMSPGSHCYFDHYQSKLSSEPIAIGGYTNLEKVYNYEPIPKALSVSEANFVIGAQANVWTEYMPDFNHVMYMVYPRAIALSEVLWSRSKPNYNDFTVVLERFHFEWMRKMGIQFSKAHLYPEPVVEPILNGVNFRLKANQQSNYNLFVKSDEKYGSMNGGMVFSTEDSMYFERTESNKIVNYNFRISSEQIKEPIEFKLKIHPGLNLPIHLETKPSSKYPGQGAFTLVDGLLGINPWKGSQYLGFDTNNVQLKVSLPTNKKTNQIHISALTDESAWIYQPKTIEIWHLKNNERTLFKSLSYVNGFIDITGIENEIEIILIGNSKIEEGKAGAGNVPWMFLDEIIITFQ
jgi:hexosaminidase